MPLFAQSGNMHPPSDTLQIEIIVWSVEEEEEWCKYP